MAFEPVKFEKYLIYPNETVDRLTVNRSFQRIFEDIENRLRSSNISIRESTDIVYGTARFVSSDNFIFNTDNLTPSTTADYYNNILTIWALENYAKSLYDSVSSATFIAPSSEGHVQLSNNNYWVRSEYSNVDFSYIPNGTNCITGTLEIGFNNVKTIFGGSDEALSGDISSPSVVNKYETYINIGDEDVSNLEEFVEYNTFSDREDVKKLVNLNGEKISVPFFSDCEATLKHNICNWTTYSSYKQSCVELHFSSSLNMKSLYESQYGHDTFYLYNSTSDCETIDTRHFRHPKISFEQKPIVMMQVGFYSDDSTIKPLFGFDNRMSATTEPITSTFKSYDTISLKPITKNSEDSTLSPVDGFVMVKEFENEYDEDGMIVNNIIHFDVVMKFMVGSAADPKMIYGLTTMNTRAKIQFALIGV